MRCSPSRPSSRGTFLGQARPSLRRRPSRSAMSLNSMAVAASSNSAPGSRRWSWRCGLRPNKRPSGSSRLTRTRPGSTSWRGDWSDSRTPTSHCCTHPSPRESDRRAPRLWLAGMTHPWSIRYLGRSICFLWMAPRPIGRNGSSTDGPPYPTLRIDLRPLARSCLTTQPGRVRLRFSIHGGRCSPILCGATPGQQPGCVAGRRGRRDGCVRRRQASGSPLGRSTWQQT